MPDDTTNPPEARWTTGQGLGFLVLLPGLIIIAVGVVSMLGASVLVEDREEMRIGIVSGGVVVFLGLVAAIPGLVVFTNCAKRRS